MADTLRRLKHRFGQVVAVLVLLFTLAFVPVGYDLWQAEPTEYISLDPSSLAYDFAFFLAVGIPLIVGLYLSRNVYRWSKNYR